MINRRVINKLPWFVIIAFYFVIIYPKLFLPNSNILRLSDIYLPYFPEDTNLEAFISAWQPRDFGSPNRPELISLIGYMLIKLVGTVTAQRILAFFPMLLASLTMYLFLTKSNLIESFTVRTIVSIVYSVNWAVFTVPNGDPANMFSSTGLMITYAVMPVVMLFSFKIFLHQKQMVYNTLGLAFSLTVATMGNVQAVVHVMPIFIWAVIAYTMFEITQRNVRPLIQRVLPFFVFCAALLLYLLLVLPVTVYYLSEIIPLGIEEGFKGLYGLKIFIKPNIHWYQRLYPYEVSPLLMLSSPKPHNALEFLGFLAPAVAVVPLLFKRPKIKAVISFSLILTLLVLTTWISLVKVNSSTIDLLYGMSFFNALLGAFRTPHKFFLAISPILCVLIALGLDFMQKEIFSVWSLKHIHRHLDRFCKKIVTIAFFFLLLSPILFNHDFAILSLESMIEPGTVTSTQGGWHKVPHGYIYPVLLELSSRFNEMRDKEGPFRVLWLPRENVIRTQLSVLDPSGDFFPPKDEFLLQYFFEIIDRMRERNISNLGMILSPLNIRYIVVIKFLNQTIEPAIHFSGSFPEHIVGNPLTFIELLNEQGDLTLIENAKEYAIYRNDVFFPMISGSTRLHKLYTYDNREVEVYSAWSLLLKPSYDHETTVFTFSESLEEINAITIANDKQENFWFPIAGGTGEGSRRVQIPTLSDDTANVQKGSDSLRIAIDPGPYYWAGIEHDYSSPQNWSDKDLISLFLYGLNDKEKIRIELRDGPSILYKNIRDNWSGWKRIFLPLDSFIVERGNPSFSSIDKIRIAFLSQGTRYLDYVLVDVLSEVVKVGDESSIEIQLLDLWPSSYPVKYVVEVTSTDPVYLVLGQSYDPSWKAYVVDDEGSKYELLHFKVQGWSNGYYLDQKGTHQVILIYELQYRNNFAILVWVLTLSIAAFIFVMKALKFCRDDKFRK